MAPNDALIINDTELDIVVAFNNHFMRELSTEVAPEVTPNYVVGHVLFHSAR